MFNHNRIRLNGTEITVEPATLDATQATPLTVETIDNHIYFYAEVDSDRVLAMIRILRETDSRLRNERLSRNLPDEFPMTPIWLHIQSLGGDLFAGLSVIEQIKQIPSPIYSVVEGVCASAATLIAMACSNRYMQSNSFFLIHELQSIFWGKHEAFKDEMKLQEKAMSLIVDFYEAHTNLSKERIQDMLKHDYWMDAKEAIEAGFVDIILE